MTTTPALPEPRLNFAWADEKRRSFLLLAFILLSLLAHAATFFFFQVTYPQQVTIPPPAPTVSMLDASREDHQPILRWVAAADPALTAVSSVAEPKGLLDVQYRPSFATPRTPLRFVPPESEPVRFPPALDAPSLIRRIQPPIASSAEPLPKSSTRLAISGPLSGRPLSAEFNVNARVQDSPQSTTFLVGVGANGSTKYSFLQSSSGQSTLDQAAAAELLKIRFAPGQEEITWGMITIDWGDDVFARAQDTNSGNNQ